jgi:hypothetical protein
MPRFYLSPLCFDVQEPNFLPFDFELILFFIRYSYVFEEFLELTFILLHFVFLSSDTSKMFTRRDKAGKSKGNEWRSGCDNVSRQPPPAYVICKDYQSTGVRLSE